MNMSEVENSRPIAEGAEMQQPAVSSTELLHEPAWKVETIGEVPAEVEVHIRKNIVTASNNASKCVDGGYRPGEAEGELARPGADLGLCILLMSLGKSPQEAFDIVLKFRTEAGQQFGWHTDMHADPISPEDAAVHEEHSEKQICGCGHCVVADKHSPLYDIKRENAVKELLEVVRAAYDQNAEQFSFVNLNRDHHEVGVLIVNSADYSVAPWDLATNKQFFIYDALRDTNLLKEFGQYLRDNGILDVTDQQLSDESKKHTNNTLGLLESSQGKPVYSVSINAVDEKITIAREEEVAIINPEQ
jgi:hypothetical protein